MHLWPLDRYRQFSNYIFPLLLCFFIIVIVIVCAGNKHDYISLITKHYHKGGSYLYGGYTHLLIKEKDKVIFYNIEGVSNYSNIKALAETAPPWSAKNAIEGFPATERLIASVLYYIVIHFFPSLGIQNLTLILSISAWILSIFLIYKITRLFFPSKYAPALAAILLALNPIFIITFSNIKFQHFGTVFLLMGIYAYEAYIKKMENIFQKMFSLSMLFFLGMFCMGGTVFLFAYLVMTALFRLGKKDIKFLLSVVISLCVAKLAQVGLSNLYNLPSVEKTLGVDYVGVIIGTVQWLFHFFTGQSLEDQFFLGYPGTSFFSLLLPVLLNTFFRENGIVALVAAAGLLFEKSTRRLVLMAAVLFCLGHGATIVTRWFNYYGYLSLPAVCLLIIAVARLLDKLITKYPKLLPGVAFLLLLLLPLRINSYLYYQEAYLIFPEHAPAMPLHIVPTRHIYIHWDNGHAQSY